MKIEELLKMATEFDLGPPPVLNGKVVSELPPNEWHHHICLKKTKREGYLCWAIVDGPMVLNKETDEWEYSLIPSERTEEFKQKTRFHSVEDALNFYEGWKQRILSQHE
jgi:hypothetical protein